MKKRRAKIWLLHINAGHGKKGSTNKAMRHDEDAARMAYVIHNYDTLELALNKQGNPAKDGTYKNSKGEPGPRLLFTKKLDGTYYVVEAIQDNAEKQLQVVSAYLSPDAKKGAQSKNSGTPGAQAPNASPNVGPYTLGFTSETGLPSPSGDNIPHSSQQSNSNATNPVVEALTEASFEANEGIATNSEAEAEVGTPAEESAVEMESMMQAGAEKMDKLFKRAQSA